MTSRVKKRRDVHVVWEVGVVARQGSHFCLYGTGRSGMFREMKEINSGVEEGWGRVWRGGVSCEVGSKAYLKVFITRFSSTHFQPSPKASGAETI